jgi:hypothetical protein
MAIIDEISGLTSATNDLLNAVNTSKAILDSKVALATVATATVTAAQSVVDAGTTILAAVPAAQTAATQAQQSMLSLYGPSTTRTGKSTAPITGSGALSVGTFLAETPAPATTTALSQLVVFARALGNVTIRRYSKSGNVVTELANTVLAVNILGLQTLTVNMEWGPNEFMAIEAPGVLSYVSGGNTPGQRCWIVSSGVVGTLQTTNLEIAPVWATLVQTVTSSTFADLQSKANAVDTVAAATQALRGDTVVHTGVSGSPMDGSAFTASEFLLESPAPAGANSIAGITIFAKTAGTVTIRRRLKVSNIMQPTVATYTFSVTSGLQTFGVGTPVTPGEYLTIQAQGIATFTSGVTSGAGGNSVNADGTLVGIGSNTLQVAVNWTVPAQIVTATAFTALDARVSAQVALIPPRAMPTASTAPTFSDKRTLTSWRAALSRIKATSAGAKASILLTGDSWADYPAIPRGFTTVLQGLHGNAGNGYISFYGDQGTQEHHQNASLNVTKANWTTYDAASGVTAPTFGCSLDGECISTTGTTATLTVAGWSDSNLDIYYSQQSTGAFRYRVDAGTWSSPVTATGVGGIGTASIAGLSNTSHTLDIDTTVNNGGTVALFALNAYNSAATGVLIHKAGNAGITGKQFGDIIAPANIMPMAAKLLPHIVCIWLGTNDYRTAGNTPTTLVAGVRAMIAAYRAADPTVGIIVCAPARTNGTASSGSPLLAFRDAIYAMCIADGIEFYNDYDMFADWSVENTAGMFADALHKNDLGGLRTAHGVSNALLTL